MLSKPWQRRLIYLDGRLNNTIREYKQHPDTLHLLLTDVNAYITAIQRETSEITIYKYLQIRRQIQQQSWWDL